MATVLNRYVNRADSATHVKLTTVSSTVASVLFAANQSRIGFVVSNPSNQAIYIRFKTAAIDNNLHGIYVAPDGIYQMPEGSIYTGEISVIAAIGMNISVSAIQW